MGYHYIYYGVVATIKLFPFQQEGVNFLKTHSFALLADEMGLGKTPQAIIASQNLDRILVVCPACARINWEREFWKWAGRTFHIAQGPPVYHKNNTIVSYDYLTQHLEFFKCMKWDLLILDEAHYLKEPTSKRTLAILGNNGIIHNAKRTWALTGTPAPNHAGELWTLLYTFGAIKLSYDGFTARYCKSYQVGRYGRVQITGSNTQHTPELKSILKVVSLRRLKTDVLKQLPPIFHSILYIEKEGDPLKDYPSLKEKIEIELQKLKEAIDFHGPNPSPEKLLSVLQVMSRSVSALRRYHGLSKIKPVASLIYNELISQSCEKIVVFAIHKDVIKELAKTLHQFNPVVITGATPMQERQDAIDNFQKDPKIQVFIGNIKAAGTAITLTAANQVLFVEQEWTPGDNAQAAMRCHRIGQTRPVTVRYASLVNSFDDKITALLSRKAQELSTFID